MIISNDIETALQALLEETGYSTSAHTIPASLGESLPHVHIVQTGGYTYDRIIESHRVDFDVYAEDPAAAHTEAMALCGWVRDLWGQTLGTSCYSSEVTTLPYHNPDPRHPSLSRTTFKAEILTRTA